MALQELSASDRAVVRIHSALNEVCNGVAISNETWARYFAVPPSEVRATFERWLAISAGRSRR
jgi:predicted DNA binding protein